MYNIYIMGKNKCLIRIYYGDGEQVYYINNDDDNNEVHKILIKEKNESKGIFYFGMTSKYEKSISELLRYKQDFNKECKEIKKYVDYKKLYSHNRAVYYFWYFSLSDNKKKLISEIPKITKKEFFIMERCNNAGLVTINMKYKEQKTQCYGADFSRYYPNLMQSFMLPIKEGVIKSYNNVEFGKLIFGIYRVEVRYENDEFTNMFNFNEFHHYTSSTLNYLYEIKDLYGLTFKLLEEDEEYDYNALIYDNDSIIKGEDLFGPWFKKIEKMRKEFPNNGLVKHLGSTLWGTLTAFNKEYFNSIENIYAEYRHYYDDEADYQILEHKDDNYICCKTDNPYKYPLARMKPFLSGFGRIKIMKILITNDLVSSLVRVHTDGIVLNKFIDYSKCVQKYQKKLIPLKYYPLPENKTTGLITFHNALYSTHHCPHCDFSSQYNIFKSHECT